ncbi:MAG: PmoA family protein [Bacteroidaceae bacterium]|nr:PmoA family protein [Bacteroidaceae bacterium]
MFSFPLSAARNVSAVKIGNRIDITIGDQFFTSYRFYEDEKYPFFFPVNGPLSGGSVTSMRNGTYPHHSSLFFGCDRVNGGNYWQEGLERGRIISVGARVVQSGQETAIIQDECIWKRPDAEAPIRDKRVITISSPSEKLYQLDFEIEMEMLMDVSIQKTNHSLFSARIAEDLTVRQGGVMLNSEGQRGEKDTFSARASWLGFYGRRKTGYEGIVIMQHPSSRWFPSPWFTRDYGFMSPTPMYWPQDGEQTVLKKGEVVRLKYRVLVFGGTPEEAGIQALYDKYASE